MICVGVSGPRRYDIAQRVVNSGRSDERVVRNTNWRLSSPLIWAWMAPTSTEPSAARNPSTRRFLSCSVWSRPIIQVPALLIAL